MKCLLPLLLLLTLTDTFPHDLRGELLDRLGADPSGACEKKLYDILQDPQIALLFIDAIGKPQSGLLLGNLHWWGDYELCKVLRESQDFVFCKSTGVVNVTGDVLSWTTCLPLDCKEDFIDIILDLLLDRSITPLPDEYDPDHTIPFIHNLRDIENTLVTTCQKDIEFDAGAYIAMIVCIIFITFGVLGSIRGLLKNWFIIELKLKCRSKSPDDQVLWSKGTGIVIHNEGAIIEEEKKHGPDVGEKENGAHAGYDVVENLYSNGPDPEEENPEEETPLPDILPLGLPKRKKFNTTEQIIRCFSIQRNLKILLDTTTKPGQILCLNGIRSLSIGWVLLTHMYLISVVLNTVNNYQLYTFGQRKYFDIITNGFPAVDSFFLLSGFLVCYLLLKNFSNGQTFDKIGIHYYIHRYIRLTIPYAVVILVEAFLYRQFITGPFQDNLQKGHEDCKEYWWTNMLYVNNFVPWSAPAKCLHQTWFLANDMQFFIVAPLFIWLLWWSPSIGNLVLWLSIAASMGAAGLVTWVYGYSTTHLRGANGEFAYFYTKSYFRIVPYLVGIFGGWVYHKKGDVIRDLSKLKPLTKSLLSAMLWILSIVVQYWVIFGIHNDVGRILIAPVKESLNVTVPFAALGKLGWSAALLVQILLCEAGLGGPINSFLSWQGWLPISRLTYSVYLLHFGIDIAWMSQLRRSFTVYPEFEMAVTFLGLVTVINLCGVLLFVLVEQPIGNLEKVIMSLEKPPRKQENGKTGNRETENRNREQRTTRMTV